MKFTTPVSMPVTEAQYNELKPLLEAMGYSVEPMLDAMGYSVEPIVNREFIATNVLGQDNYVDNLDEWHINLNNRTFIPTYNKDLFLALAAMTDEPNGIAGEWWKFNDTTRNGFVKGNIYKAIKAINNERALIDDRGQRNGFSDNNPIYFTKASISEIFAHFGVSYGKEQKTNTETSLRGELNDIRQAIGADENESTYDEVVRLKARYDKMLNNQPTPFKEWQRTFLAGWIDNVWR